MQYTESVFAGIMGVQGSANGGLGTGTLNTPLGCDVDTSGNVYVGDGTNSAIRKISPGGIMSTLAGGVFGYADGTGSNAKFNKPSFIYLDTNANLYVSDSGNHAVRLVTPAGE